MTKSEWVSHAYPAIAGKSHFDVWLFLVAPNECIRVSVFVLLESYTEEFIETFDDTGRQTSTETGDTDRQTFRETK